ncbi:hypothetical protein HN385_04180 [archaeon]|jgi:phenylacetate-CoA ligase|nr:hypothetical protein [archaeon]MBT3451393.1 hypothetical protein [archaeon]MBT6869002.1 hypothetical protein [archaeon]MBT7193268.1 hypothetical protein [archaeon]MBT7380123.1 hypothetical protein [archaeon]
MAKWYYDVFPTLFIDKLSNKISNYNMTYNFLKSVDPELLESISEKKVMKVFKDSVKHIPAYTKFLNKHGIKGKDIKNIRMFDSIIPVTDKHNYVFKYSLLDRTRNKTLPKQSLIVESSGSSTKLPTNWFRTLEEEEDVQKDIEFESKYLFKEKEYIVISSWSLGAWTTSLSFCYHFEKLGVVKNIGPDVNQIVQTLKMMGPKFNYIIGGYPPFVKHLIDVGKLNWKKYNIDLIVGGESFVPGWRKYMKGKLKRGSKIVSVYGASDLEPGLAVETPLSQYVRELFIKNPKKVNELFGTDELPLFFQYNPLRFYIKNITETKEFHTTVLTKGHVGCKVKYNVKDLGGRLKYNDLIEMMSVNFKEFNKKYHQKFKDISIKLPFLWVAGRSDSVISLDGVNMFPQQIEMALLKNKKVYNNIQSFQTSKVFYHDGGHHFQISIELQDGFKPNKNFAKEVKETVKVNLGKINKAYKLGLKDFPACYEPYVKLYEFRKGPFNNKKIKNKYLTN